MRYLDLDVEIGPGTGRSYPIVVRSAAGDARATMLFPYDELALKDALKDLRIALLQSSQTHRALTEEETAVQNFGQRLFEALFAGVAGNLFYGSRTQATQEGLLGVRLRLNVQAPELASLPWEYLYDSNQHEYLCLSRTTPLVRYPELAAPLQPLEVTPPLRILSMIASPSNLDPLNVTREQTRMEEALKSLTSSGQVELSWLSGQTWEDLQEAMWPSRGPWHIFHFIGHGGYDKRNDEGLLALCDEEGQAHLLGARDLARLLTAHNSLRLVVLNACESAKGGSRDLFSSTAATLARRGIPAVLAMQEEITDKAAIQLTRTFYRALASGLSVDAAVAEARTAISVSLRHSLEWGTPVLFLRAADSRLFRLERALPPVVQQHDPPPAHQPDPPPLVQPDLLPAPATASAAPLAPRQEEPARAALPHETAEEWRSEGSTLYHARRYQEALEAYERALQLDPNDSFAWYLKGNALFDLQRYEEALEAFECALQLDPNDIYAWNGKGLVLRDLRRYEEALEAYERALQLDPKYALTCSNMGLVLYDLRRYEEALEAYERALQLDSNDAAAWYGKGTVLRYFSRDQDALEPLERALQLNPNYVAAWYNKGHALSALKRFQDALDAFERVLQLDPNDAAAWYNKGSMLSNLQRYPEALEAFQRELQLNPDSTLGWFNKGLMLYYLQRYQEAIAAYNRTIELGPTIGIFYDEKAKALEALGRKREAKQARQQARKLGWTG